MAPQSTTDDGITRLCAVTCSHSGRRLRHYVFAFLPRVEGRGRAAVAQFRRDRRPGCSGPLGLSALYCSPDPHPLRHRIRRDSGPLWSLPDGRCAGSLTWSSEAGAIGKDYCRMEKNRLHIRQAGRHSIRRWVTSRASARSSSDPLASSTPRACSCRTKSSNWLEANASRNVNCSDRNIIAAFLVEPCENNNR